MMQPDDAQLIKSILDGDIRNYSVLVNRNKDLAFTIAFRLLNNREDAEEVVQDAFVKAYRGLSGFRHDSRFSTWLFRIVYNTAISKKRLQKHTLQTMNDMAPYAESSLSTEQEEGRDEEAGPRLERAMQKLPEEERVLITLYYIHESSVEEIHRITGLTKVNIKVRLFRARKKLRESMGLMAERICT
jgi:RNA polymerase sigma-70 factor (ECF subfamily)